MFDRVHLEAIMDLRRWTDPEFAVEADVDRHTINRIKRGKQKPSYETVQKIAKGLKIFASDLDDQGERPSFPENFTWCDVGRARDLYEELRSADTVISCVAGMPAYLQIQEIHDWAFVRAHQAAGWAPANIEQALTRIIQTGNGDLSAYQNSNCVHRIIGREWWMRQVLAHEPDWAAAIRKRLLGLEGKALLGLIPIEREREFDNIMSAAVAMVLGPPGYWDWVSVGLMYPRRPVVAVIRPSRDFFLVTHHRPTMERLLHALARLQEHLYDADTLPPVPSRAQDRKTAIRRTAASLDHIARSAKDVHWPIGSVSEPQLNDALWAQLALRPEPLKTRFDEQTVVDGPVAAG